ncbi:MAG: hypothetical protein KF895_02750 [Parvibaculum sp.]|nr:hypothetical protein [Parvibaculum sp.]
MTLGLPLASLQRRRHRRHHAVPAIPTPQQVFGGDLLGLIDFAAVSTLTLSLGRVSAIFDPIAGLTFSQAFSSQRPAYDARGIAIFDGIDDCLEALSNPYATGSAPCEIIAVVRQDLTGSDGATRSIWGMGNSNNSGRRLLRNAPDGTNRFGVSQGLGSGTVGSTEGTVDFSGAHIVRGLFTETTVRAQIGSMLSAIENVSPNTGGSRARIGANPNATASQFAQIGLAAVGITRALSTEKWNASQPWFEAARQRFYL